MAGVSGAAPKRVSLITAGQVGANPGGTSQWIDISAYPNVTFYFKTTGNPGAGTCVIEECDYDEDSQVVGGQTMSAIVTVDVDVSVGTDGQYAYHLPAGRAYSFVRARIGTSVTVATLDVVMVAN